MKLKQVGEEYKICPCCKMRTLVLTLPKESIKEGRFNLGFYPEGTLTFGYHYECHNCKAKFIDEDLIKKLKGGKRK